MSIFNRKKNNTPEVTTHSVSEAETRGKVVLKKATEGLDRSIVRLKKDKGIDLQGHKARVFVVIDRSGSMSSMYRNGEVQEVLTRLLPLALKFDDNGELEVYVFNTDCHQLKEMTLKNYENYVEKEIIKKGKGPFGGTCYAPVVEKTTKSYNNNNPAPAFGIVITDGENSDRLETDTAIRKSSKYKIFYQFVGIGYDNFSYLQKLDDLDGRAVDNTAFIKVADFKNLTDDQLYDKLLEQYPDWLKAMNIR